MKTKILSALIVIVMIAALAVPVFASDEPSGEPVVIEPVEFPDPDEAKIVSATMYSEYTKKPDSFQDAIIKATLYWDQTNEEVYEIRFLQAFLPWDDNGVNDMGWACIKDEDLLATLEEADAVVEVRDGIVYAKYLQFGDMVWTGEMDTHPACGDAVEWFAEIDGETVGLLDYGKTQEGGAWYHEAVEEDVLILTSDEVAEDADAENVAATVTVPYKETNGHGTFFWMSDITFPGNIEAIKQFVIENGFDYDYYADGGITQNEDGYWETADAVTGATLDETPTYLDILKTLYNDIMDGNYVEEN